MELSEQRLDLVLSHAQTVTTGLQRIFDNQLHTDVTFLVGGGQQPVQRVCAHRIILASQSDYFDCLLYGPMKEGRAEEIALQDTPVEAFRELLRFMYCGTMSSINLTTALDLHILSDRFGFHHLRDDIETHLITILSVKNVLHFHSHTQLSFAPRLQNHCKIFMDYHAKEVIRSPAIPYLPKETLKMLVIRDTFVIEELHIFDAVEKWIKRNGVDRDRAMDLLECVRLSEISTTELQLRVLPSGLYEEEKVMEAMGRRKEMEIDCLATRGKTGGDLNLFSVSGTKLVKCANYLLDILPEKADNWSYVSDFIFTLMSPASQDSTYITVKFDDIYIVNQITFEGYPADSDAACANNASRENSPFCYQVWVSRDGNHWVTILDYSRLKCYSVQRLFFTKMGIRIVQSRGREGSKIHLGSCSYVGPVPYNFRQKGVIAPFIPMTPDFREFVRFSESHCLARLFIMFTQPYSINTVKCQLQGLEGSGDVTVSVATQNRTKAYQLVAKFRDIDLSTCLKAEFSEQPVSIVSIGVSELRLPDQYSPRSLDCPIPHFSVREFTCQSAEH